MTSISVASYYASLSICSFISVKHKFKEQEYKWIEKWIHFVCVCLPLAYSLWMITEENINPYGSGCYGASSPLGCQADPDLVCERGSDRINLAVLIVGLAQLMIYFVIPSCSMLALYLFWGKSKKRSQSSKGMKQIIEAAREKMLWGVMLQIALYLFSFWGTYVLGLIHFVIQTVTGKIPYNLLIVSNALVFSQGFIVMLVYFQLQRITKRDDSMPQAKSVKDATAIQFKRFARELRLELGLIMTYKRQTNGDQMKWSFQYLMALQMSLVLGRNILTKRRKTTMNLSLRTKHKSMMGPVSSLIYIKIFFTQEDEILCSGQAA